MKTLIVYDSFFGKTERVAQAIAAVLGKPPEVELRRVAEYTPEDLSGVQRLIVGSPTHNFWPSPRIQAFLAALPEEALRGLQVAVFDTRLVKERFPLFLRFIFRQDIYAGRHIAAALRMKGAQLLAPPQGFMVEDSTGPLAQRELERAQAWARRLGQAK